MKRPITGWKSSSVVLAFTLFGKSNSFVVLPKSPCAFPSQQQTATSRRYNVYDDWRSDAVVDTMVLEEDLVLICLEEFIDSDYGQQMFGCHERARGVGITGRIEFVELCGPQVTLRLDGEFWHRRETVLGRAAMWLNARMPEITDVTVADMEELRDIHDEVDEVSGEVLYQEDKRSPDFNGDRGTMEYQGMDPDMRGPFPQGPMGKGNSMLSPS
jgi:hypothetical protein